VASDRGPRPQPSLATVRPVADATSWLRTGADGTTRCWWGGGDNPEYVRYHDEEWGRPVVDDTRLFEKLCLEGFQAGLSWLTILRKREAFRSGFAGFDSTVMARFDQDDIERLMGDAGIVRHRGKIDSTVNNAARALDLIDECGSLARYIWSWEPQDPTEDHPAADADPPIPATTATSTALSKDLKRRGWSFVGPTTAYAFMQAMGLVNDHVHGCDSRSTCAQERSRLTLP
jgi:DNA-3-methyladenine glycosylase I